MVIEVLMHVSPLSWIGLACAVVAAGIMIYYLVKRPPLDAAGKSMMMLGVGVLPIFVAMVGNLEGFNATETQGFCGSCHTMDMWIEDANDPDSESLAAIHSRTTKFGDKSCYVCHKDYGMYGYAMTKLGGMGHVYEFLSGWMWYDREQVLEEIHIKRPFKNENCMQCHSTTGAIWTNTQDHIGLLDDLRAGTTSCVSAGCHGYAHPFSKPQDGPPSAAQIHSTLEGAEGVEQ
jgi:cytochrome c-type protein NapC